MPKKRNTPIREQYLSIKARHQDAILFFRLGDFYETFDDDAQTIADELDVVLTSRNVSKGTRVPMAGVPHHAAEGYIAKLIAKGYKVAICEQTAKAPVNGLMPREVVRVVTPGTVVEPVLLSEKRNNYLAAVALAPTSAGIAYVDITTGEFAATQLASGGAAGAGESLSDALLRELDRLAPAEVILSDNGDAPMVQGEAEWAEARKRYPFASGLDVPLTLYDAWRFDDATARQAVLEHFRVDSLAGYGCEDLPLAASAAGVILQYLRQHQPSAVNQIVRLRTYSTGAFMTLDVATRRSLELTHSLRDRTLQGSLLWVLDQTLTPMGGRLLNRWMSQPLLDLDALSARHAAVQACHDDLAGRMALRQELKGLADLERLANRVIQGIAGPRDLIGLRRALERVGDLQRLVAEMAELCQVPGACEVEPLNGQGLNPCEEVTRRIGEAIAEDAPALLTKGGVIRPGFSPELDAIEQSVAGSKAWIASLESTERQRTGIKTLKVGYNKVFGYYLEVTKANTDQVPEEYIRKQTLVNAERYITSEMKERETVILGAEEQIIDLEQRLFHNLLLDLAPHAEAVLASARAVAHLDVYLSMAEVAAEHGYVRPELVDDATLEIAGGRHPVVERTLSQNLFVPNNTHMAPDHAIHVITGPNMSGKSTYLRQVALIVYMAQIGAFVPAESARIGLVDRIFSRVGAQDEIAAGHSTFMVEMVETANILNHATPRSLLILDEIGRGTSTYDGLSIAWAVIEFLHNHPRLQCKTLFATHYHELTELEGLLPRVANYNVAVTHQGDEVVFTHNIVPGGADRSYGIHVAQMAGLPAPVIHRAEELLDTLEQGAEDNAPLSTRVRAPAPVQQLALFQETDPALEALLALDVMSLSPIEALNKLYELQQKAQ